jgi:hypothetical protein
MLLKNCEHVLATTVSSVATTTVPFAMAPVTTPPLFHDKGSGLWSRSLARHGDASVGGLLSSPNQFPAVPTVSGLKGCSVNLHTLTISLNLLSVTQQSHLENCSIPNLLDHFPSPTDHPTDLELVFNRNSVGSSVKAECYLTFAVSLS